MINEKNYTFNIQFRGLTELQAETLLWFYANQASVYARSENLDAPVVSRAEESGV